MAASSSHAAGWSSDRAAWWAVVTVLVIIAAAYARLRWTGYLPIGSDNDEYQLAGQALASFDQPLIAGVEGTKYPWGYPLLLAVLQWLRLPVATTALGLNLVAIVGAAVGMANLAGRATPTRPFDAGAALAAGAVVVTSASVWNDAYSVMPEAVLLGIVVLLLHAVDGPLTGRRLLAVMTVAVAAVLFKTLAILVLLGGCGIVWLAALRRPALVGAASTRTGRAGAGAVTRTGRAVLPAVAALTTVLAGMLVMRPLPEHTTGYLATFALRDPFDASQGRLAVGGLLRRAVDDIPVTVTDLGRAIALIDAGPGVAAVVAALGLGIGVIAAFRLRPGSPLGPFVAGAVIAYALGLFAWPYHSSRFGIPLVPVAALGAGWLTRLVTARLPGVATRVANGPPRTRSRAFRSLPVGALVAAALVATSWGAVAERAEGASERLAAQHAAMDRLEVFVERELPDARLASFDYREVAHRLERPVQPLSYTSDTSELLRQVGDAQAVVRVDIHGTRNQLFEQLVTAEPDRFTPLLVDEDVAVYRVER